MTTAASNGLQIAYDTFGKAIDPPLLLIAGLGSQMITWPDDFCDHIAAQEFYVIRFDNRDVGLSSKIEEAGTPDIVEMLTAKMEDGFIAPPYTLADMADDAAGLLDSLGIDRAHICGRSMGGMSYRK